MEPALAAVDAATPGGFLLVLAIVILAALIVTSVYTAAKWVYYRIRRSTGGPTA